MKKKHRKKSKGRTPRKDATHAVHVSRSKRGDHERAHTKSASHSLALLRAIKRRRAAEHGAQSENAVMHGPGREHHKRPHPRAHKHSPRSAEPVVTEKSFENMLAYRRFQNHAR